jgi:hypothetical protein
MPGTSDTIARPEARFTFQSVIAATILDPQGPKVWRAVPYTLTVLALAFALFGPLDEAPSALLGLGAFALLHLLGVVSLRQHVPRSAAIVTGPGYVKVEGARSRNQRISAMDVVGATTARMPSGIALTIHHRFRDQPLTLTVATEAEVDAIRHCLGVGHRGFGVVGWRTESDAHHATAIVTRVACAIFTVLAAGVYLLAEESAVSLVLLALGVLGLPAVIAMIVALASLAAAPAEPTIIMTARGLQLKVARGWLLVPYASIVDVSVHREAVAIVCAEPGSTLFVRRRPRVFGNASDEELAILAAQIRAASHRARGLGRPKDDVAAHLDVLRRSGESLRDWLVRLDLTGQMLSAGHGYRGSPLDTGELWTVLEDPDADAALRTAALRVLRHLPTPEARGRIEGTLAAVRDESTSERLRIAACADVDTACEELLLLEAIDPTNAAATPFR